MSDKENCWKRTFFIIWAGQAFSIIGSSAAQFAIIWWLTVRTGSPVVLAMATMAGFLPQAIVGPFAGVWGGLKDKLLMISLALGALGLALAVAGTLPPSGFVAFAILCVFMGLTGNFFTVPYIAYIQSSVPPASLGRVFALLTGMMSLATPAGLFLAGPAAAIVGVAAWFSISGVLILLAAVFGYAAIRRC